MIILFHMPMHIKILTHPLWRNGKRLFNCLKVPKDYEQYPDEYCFTLGNLATICSIRSDFEKADKYFEQLFSELEDSIIYQNRALILNYITNLNKLKGIKGKHRIVKSKPCFWRKIREFSQFKTQEIVVACFLK